MFEDLGRDVFVNVIFHCQLDRDPHQVERKHSHPTGAVALFKMSTVREGSIAIEHSDVIEAEESALENVFAFGILPIHPPSKGKQHFMEDRFQKCAITFAGLLALDLINPPRRPGEDGGVHVTKIPFVRGNVTVRMLIPFAHNNIDLAFGEMRIDQCERDAMKTQVPRSVPWKFPSIGHGHDALIVEVSPFGVASVPARGWGRRICRIPNKPLLYNIMVKLLGPKHSR